MLQAISAICAPIVCYQTCVIDLYQDADGSAQRYMQLKRAQPYLDALWCKLHVPEATRMAALARRAVTNVIELHRGIHEYCEQRLDTGERIAPSMGLRTFYNRRLVREVAPHVGYQGGEITGLEVCVIWDVYVIPTAPSATS
jgi:hypothetical protein